MNTCSYQVPNFPRDQELKVHSAMNPGGVCGLFGDPITTGRRRCIPNHYPSCRKIWQLETHVWDKAAGTEVAPRLVV